MAPICLSKARKEGNKISGNTPRRCKLNFRRHFGLCSWEDYKISFSPNSPILKPREHGVEGMRGSHCAQAIVHLTGSWNQSFSSSSSAMAMLTLRCMAALESLRLMLSSGATQKKRAIQKESPYIPSTPVCHTPLQEEGRECSWTKCVLKIMKPDPLLKLENWKAQKN